MAKISSVVKNNKRKELANKCYKKRSDLRKKSLDMKATEEERDAAFLKLQRMPRNTSKVRVRNRCEITGRSRGVYQAFGLSRIKLRELANQGLIPGVTKASW